MKRRGFTWIEIVVVLAVIILLAAILIPLFAHRTQVRRRESCYRNIRQVALGFSQYARDNDELYPPIAVNASLTYGWADAVQPYVKSVQILQCPSEPNAQVLRPNAPGYTDFWYNARLSVANQANINFVSNVLLLGEGNDGSDVTTARYSKANLPSAWLKDTSKPPFRHLDGANYAFADFHVKWLKPAQVTTAPPNGRNYTFAIK